MDSEENTLAIFSNITTGEQARLTRLAKRLRQIDVASQANVTVQEIIRLEKDNYVRPTRRKRIMAVLGLDEADSD
jgi:transcriptional regulator with XRE-family HTH domain